MRTATQPGRHRPVDDHSTPAGAALIILAGVVAVVGFGLLMSALILLPALHSDPVDRATWVQPSMRGPERLVTL